jgi:tRNA A-37 threonylcarbamoyl transferase component Bud32
MRVIEQLNAALSGRYDIDREIGAGGMATVYLAQDVRHDRRVAVKVLHPELSAVIGADRFLAEIKTTAALQHPHILPLFDSGSADGQLFYVMPFVEGETLRHRLLREKQLPIDDAVRIAKEVASALDYAHRHGVIHRDIKPENILLHDGSALVADFGIALAVQSAGGQRMTQTGLSLGTPHYMSPEQAMGEREITARSDVYALGAITYEMLIGETPFNGPTAQAVVAKAITEEPRPLTPQRKSVPLNVDMAVLKALEKLPADRFASAQQFAEALTPSAEYTGASTGRNPIARGGNWTRVTSVLAALAAASIVTAAWALARPRLPAPVSRFVVTFPPSEAAYPTSQIVLSRDGSQLLYAGPGANNAPQLWLKRRDRANAVGIPGTMGVSSYALARDASFVVWVERTGQVKKMATFGGAALVVADSATGNGASVAVLDDGSVVYLERGLRALRRASETGTTRLPIAGDDSLFTALAPVALPGRPAVLFARCHGACTGNADLWVADFDSRTMRAVVRGAVKGFYLPSGHLLYVRPDGALLTAPFDLGKLAVTGPPIPVADSVVVIGNMLPLLGVADDGTLMMRYGASSLSRTLHELTWVDRTGRQTPVDSTWTFDMSSAAANAGWSLSPDGRKLAIGLVVNGHEDIWVKELPRGPLSRVSFDSGKAFRPRWNADGRAVRYLLQDPRSRVVEHAADGTGATRELFVPPRGILESELSPDGSRMIVRLGGIKNQLGGRDLFVYEPKGDPTLKPLVASKDFDESAVALSPDGRFFAYESNETGRTEVYVRPFPNSDGGKWQVSTDGGLAPRWSPNGRELFYVSLVRNMVATPVSGGATPAFGVRKTLFHLADDVYLPLTDNYAPYEVAGDGQKFLMARAVKTEAGQTAPLMLIENWFEELKSREKPPQ